MKALTRTIMELAVLAGLAGCAKENVDSPEKNPAGNTLVTLTANQENAESKAAISSTDTKVINWTKNDAITVIDGAGKNAFFILTEGDGTSSGKFKGDVSKTADSYTALYPYQNGVTASNGSLSGVELKSEQKAVAGSFDPEAALMMAESKDGSLSFKNIVGFVKVTPTISCARITLVSNNSEDVLAGTADITMANGLPKAEVKEKASSSVSIVGDIEAGKTYYIAIFPAAMTSGFRLVFTTHDGQDTYKSTGKPLEIKRNLVTNLGSVEGITDGYPYVTFTAASEQTFWMDLASGITLEYSVGGAGWQSVVNGSAVKFGGSYGSLRLRGKNEKGTCNSSSSTIKFYDSNVEVRCKGDIRTLIDWENYDNANTEKARFSSLFYGCSVLVTAPDLPSEKLSASCYASIFSGCSALTKAPDLPAENVPASAYSSMFKSCSSLEEMPQISAKTVELYGMSGMFAECSKLTKVKGLCIETFTGTNNCDHMFTKCTKITEATLPATTLANQCYSGIFEGCSSLKNVTLKVKDFNNGILTPFKGWLVSTAETGTVHIRKGLSDETKTAISLPNNNWTFEEDVTD